MPLFSDIFNRIFGPKASIDTQPKNGFFAPKVEQTADTIKTTEYKPVVTTNNIITKKLVLKKYSKEGVLISQTNHNVGDTIDLQFKKTISVPPPALPVRQFRKITFNSTLNYDLIPGATINIYTQDAENGKVATTSLTAEKTIELTTINDSFADIKIDVSNLGNYIVKGISFKKVNQNDLFSRMATDFEQTDKSYLEITGNQLSDDYIVVFDIIFNPEMYPVLKLESPTLSIDVDETYLNTGLGENFSITFFTKFADSYKITTPTGTKEYAVSSFTKDFANQIVQLNTLEHFGNKFGTANVIITPFSKLTGDGESKTLIITIGKEYEYPRLKSLSYSDYIYIESSTNRDVDAKIDYEYVLTDNVYAYLNNEDDNGLIYKGSAKGSFSINYKELLEAGKLVGNPSKIEVIVVPYNVRGDRTIKGDRKVFTITFDESEFSISSESLKEDFFDVLYTNITEGISYSDDPRYLNHIVEIGDDRQLLIANWDVDPTKFTNFKIDELGNKIPDGDINNSVVIRLYESLPTDIETHTPVWISKLMSLPVINEVSVTGFVGMKCPPLKGPNFNVNVDFVKSNSVDYSSYDEIILSGSE